MAEGLRATRRVLLASAGFLMAIQAACSSLLPDGVRAGMGDRATVNRDESSWFESMLYRIDDHRWITTRGISSCEGRMYYHDSKLGIDTLVGNTGVGGAHTGPFRGYYAIDSNYIAIPATVQSGLTGAQSVTMYYSNDEGKTFRRVIHAASAEDYAFVIVKGDYLYTGIIDPNNPKKILESDRYDISHTVEANSYGEVDPHISRNFHLKDVPLSTMSPSGATRMCK